MPTEIVTRAEARAKGLKRYFVGRPCKNGHVSERFVSSGTCCECNLQFTRDNYDRDPQYHRDRAKRRRREQPEKISAEFKRWYRDWMLTNPGANVKKTKKWLAAHPHYRREKRRNDPNFRLADVLRTRVKSALRAQNASKCAKTIQLIGCSIAQLRAHLAGQFLAGMSWENHGYGDDKWHIDHFRPIASFDLTDPAQQRVCFHFSNLRPLWQPENLRKGSKVIEHAEASPV